MPWLWCLLVGASGAAAQPVDVHVAAGAEAMRERRYLDAAREYQARVRDAPEDAASWAGLCAARLRMDDAESAVPACAHATELAPERRGYASLLREARRRAGGGSETRATCRPGTFLRYLGEWMGYALTFGPVFALDVLLLMHTLNAEHLDESQADSWALIGTVLLASTFAGAGGIAHAGAGYGADGSYLHAWAGVFVGTITLVPLWFSFGTAPGVLGVLAYESSTPTCGDPAAARVFPWIDANPGGGQGGVVAVF